MIPNTIGAYRRWPPDLCGKVFGFIKRNLSGAQRRKSVASGERSAEKGTVSLVTAERWRARSATSAPTRTPRFDLERSVKLVRGTRMKRARAVVIAVGAALTILSAQ